MGVPSIALMGMSSRSSELSTRPMPRSTNSAPFSSIVLPPTLRLAFCTAVITSINVTFAARIFVAESSI